LIMQLLVRALVDTQCFIIVFRHMRILPHFVHKKTAHGGRKSLSVTQWDGLAISLRLFLCCNFSLLIHGNTIAYFGNKKSIQILNTFNLYWFTYFPRNLS
jgi:hypothetical protein